MVHQQNLFKLLTLLLVSGENLFWLGNRNKQAMDGHLVALPFARKAFNTFSGVREERGVLPCSSICTARSGQDGFWQNSDTLPKQLCCKAEDVPVAHTFPSFVSHILVYLSPGKHNALQHRYFFLNFFVMEEK